MAVTRTSRLTAGTLFALSLLHIAWGAGSTFPFADRAALADAVVGTQDVPPAAACLAVAAALATGAAMVVQIPVVPGRLRRPGLLLMGVILAVRASLGIAGRTDAVSPGSTSTRFRRLDARLYSPLCLALAAGSLLAAGRDSERCPVEA